LRDDGLLCEADAVAQDKETARGHAEALERELVANWAPRIENLRADLDSIADPIERFVCAVVAIHQQRDWYAGHLNQTHVEYRSFDRHTAKTLAAAFGKSLSALQTSCKEAPAPAFVFDRPDPAAWKWAPEALAQWALARTAPRHQTITVFTRGTGPRGDKGQKKLKVPGMLLKSGHEHPDQSESRSPGWSYDEYLLHNGSIIRVGRGKNKAHRVNQGRPLERVEDLESLAKLLHIPVPTARVRRAPRA
jgi:hypothetical protein